MRLWRLLRGIFFSIFKPLCHSEHSEESQNFALTARQMLRYAQHDNYKDGNYTKTTTPIPRYLSRYYRGRHDPGKQSRRLGAYLCAAGAFGMERLYTY